MATIRGKAKQLSLAAHALSSHKVYDRAWSLFGDYLKLYQKDIHHLQELDLVKFVAFLALAEMAGASIHTYISGVKHHLKIWSLPDFSTSFALALVLKGVSNTNNTTDVCIPITLGMLNHMCMSLQHVIASPFLVALYTVLFNVVFHGLFRLGEFNQSLHAVTIDQVQCSFHKAEFYLKLSKCHKALLPPQLITIKAQYTLVMCPASALCMNLSFRPNVAGQLFIKVDGTPVYALDLNRVLQKLCDFLYPPTNYIKPHSFRIGGTTYLHSLGLLPATIQARGRWSSACFKWYIHPT